MGVRQGARNRTRRWGISALTAVLGAGLVAGLGASEPAEAQLPDTAAAQDFTATRVMPLGDSITRGVGSPTLSSYRIDLQNRLLKGGMEIDYVGSQRKGAGSDPDHEGHGGWSIDMLSAEVDGWLATYQPDVVLLHAGTNNLKAGDGPYNTVRKLSGLIDQIRTARPEARIFVAQVLTARPRQEAAADRMYNKLIPAMIEAKNDELITIVDQSTVHGIDLHDLRHPNDFGYSKMAWNWYRAMSRVYGLSGNTGPNPYRMTTARRCLAQRVVIDGFERHRTECRDWTLRGRTVLVDGVQTRVRTWQTLREVRRAYRVKVNGEWTARTRLVRYWAGPGDLSEL